MEGFLPSLGLRSSGFYSRFRGTHRPGHASLGELAECRTGFQPHSSPGWVQGDVDPCLLWVSVFPSFHGEGDRSVQQRNMLEVHLLQLRLPHTQVGKLRPRGGPGPAQGYLANEWQIQACSHPPGEKHHS